MPRLYEPTYKTIKTEEYIEQLNDIRKRFPRATEINETIEWALRRYPHRFTKLSDNYYHWVTDELASPDFPIVKVIFKILADLNQVTLLSIEEI